ncbi:MAG: sodium/solute symporter, partial [Planctomycetota bacterium]|nr:sodium/solute symporter [Planctomycetota bacterium]
MDTATLELGTLDYVIFFGALIGAMAVGMWAGRKEDTSEDYFLAGKGLRWFGVAGSIFGSNVSANHMVGMMGVGFSIGFAQSHFEIGAILGLLLLCFGFLPVYRKLNLYTLSEYLGKRYDDRSRISYALIMIIIMAGVQMIPALYIGSRTICELMGGDAIVSEAGSPEVAETALPAALEGTVGAQLKAKPSMKLVSMPHYTTFVIALGLIAGSYTILGGLKAVVYTDIIQSVLMLIVGIGIAILVFSQFSWGEMVDANDTAVAGGAVDRMSIYLPTHHPQLPWTGVLTGLMFMHCFYWGTNQFIVQRALGAVSDKEARVGIIAAGFLKLLIPFFSIGTGVCAYFLLTNEDGAAAVDGIAPDTIFPYLVNRYLAPIGLGLIGLVAAGVIGAILSSIDSMMNSAATIISVDIWKRFINPQAGDKELIVVGKLSIVALMISAILMALFIMNPNSSSNFFLDIANYQNYLTPGLLVAFILGIFWKRGTGTAAFVTIIAGVILSWVVVTLYVNDITRPLYYIARDSNEVSDFNFGQIPTTYN